MKLTFVNSCPYLGGAEIWHLRHALALAGRGHTVTMMARGPLLEKARAAGLDAVDLPFSFDLDPATALGAYRFFRRERPDLILLNDQREARLVAPMAALAGIRTRVQRKGWPFLKGSWRDRLVYRRFVTDLIAVSEEVARVFREKSGMPDERITVLQNGVDLDRFQPRGRRDSRARFQLPPDGLVIGSTGRLATQKGYDILLKAAARLKSDGLDPVIAIAGEGDERDRLLREATELGVRLILPGRVDEVPEFLSALDIYAFPSRKEGRSNALAEAMATGLPVAASDIPGNDELIAHGKTGLLVPPDDPAALASALSALARDRALADRLGGEARREVEASLDWRKMVEKLELLLESMIEKNRRGP